MHSNTHLLSSHFLSSILHFIWHIDFPQCAKIHAFDFTFIILSLLRKIFKVLSIQYFLKWESSNSDYWRGISKVASVKKRKASVGPCVTTSRSVEISHVAKTTRHELGAEGSISYLRYICVCPTLSFPQSSQSPLKTTGLAISYLLTTRRGLASALRLKSQSLALHHGHAYSLASHLAYSLHPHPIQPLHCHTQLFPTSGWVLLCWTLCHTYFKLN